jgi:putative alpha-1,2-mannosidase
LCRDAFAIARIAERASQQQLVERFRATASELKRPVQNKVWDSQTQFLMVLPRGENSRWSDAREGHGYTPWYFDLPDADESVARKQLLDSRGFWRVGTER